jgi:acylphosphatase
MAGVSTRSVRVVVRGMVQGVGFRWFVRERARALQLRGWVRNQPDGSVEFAACGTEAAVDALLAAARAGPSRSEVRELEVRDADPGHDTASSFDIRR